MARGKTSCNQFLSRCILDIVNVTDHSVSSENKVQVYLSGALHGNERLGPHATYYLIELLVTNYGKEPYITRLLETREIIITPMTNAPGFCNDQREEQIMDGSSEDINRDFPYNTAETQCLQTIAGRVLYKLFAENLFVSSITFHGGSNSITYPWGSNNHLSQLGGYRGAEAPDHVALADQARIMVDAAGPTFSTESGTAILEYQKGDMTSIVYSVGGGLEDWAYGAGFDFALGATL